MVESGKPDLIGCILKMTKFAFVYSRTINSPTEKDAKDELIESIMKIGTTHGFDGMRRELRKYFEVCPNYVLNNILDKVNEDRNES